MNLSKEVRRRRRRMCLAPEVLEDRVVLSAGEGSTFAIMPGTVTTAGQVSTHHISRCLRRCSRLPRRTANILIGIDIAPADAAGRRPRRRRSSPRSSRSRTRPGTSIHVQHSTVRPQGRQGE